MKRNLVSMLLLSLFAASAYAQQWQWSPPAPHHAAVVQLKTPEGREISCGSGCYVELAENCRGVLTAAHCVNDSPSTVIFADGTRLQGTSTVDRTQADCGWIVLQSQPTNIAPLRLASTAPQPGETVELCGYGASKAILRHWYAPIEGRYAERETAYVSFVMQGDSGGPVINARGEVCGVVTAGQTEAGRLGDCVIYRGTVGPSHDVVQSFSARVAQRYGGIFIGVAGGCQPGRGCPGGSCPSPRQVQPSQAFPPQQPQQSAPPSMVPVPPIAPRPDPQLVIGLPALQDLLAKDPRFRGADGKDGQPGAPGPAGADAVLDYDRLINLMAADGRFRGPTGQDGKDGTPGAAGPPGAAATIDQAALATQVAAQLPPIYLRKRDSVTGQETVEPIRLGEGFTFITHPK